jgi:hypothetical protein
MMAAKCAIQAVPRLESLRYWLRLDAGSLVSMPRRTAQIVGIYILRLPAASSCLRVFIEAICRFKCTGMEITGAER